MSGIIVTFPKPEDCKAIKSLLIRNGHSVVYTASTGAMAINLADQLGEGIIICGHRLPDMLYSNIYENLDDRFEMLLVASRMKILEDELGIATLEMPLRVRDLLNSVEMMDHNLQAKYRKGKHKVVKRTEEEQSIVDEAKAVLMEKNNMTESEAHRYIQKSAMNSGRTMVDTAEEILAIMYKE